LAIALTQFFWVPGLLNINSGSDMAKGSWKGLEVNGLALGDPESPVKIEEFTDFQCPFCAKAHFVIMQLIEKYPGQIYHVHRDMPLDQACNPYLNRPFHPDACNAAMVSRCASMQGKFREMEELLFSNRHDLKKDDLVKYVQEIGLDSDQYNACLQNPETMEAIVKDIQEAKKRGVTGTPAFFVNGEAIKGFKPIEFWEQKVTEILKKEK
jgi:protein-disulfide isomerase